MSSARLFIAALALLFAALVAYAGWILFGAPGLAIAIVVTSPIVGLAVASPLLEVFGRGVAGIRTLAYRDLEGRFFEYKGKHIDVREDLSGCRWLSLDDVRKVVPNLPHVRTLMRIMPDDVAHLESSRHVRVSARGLKRYLSKSESPSSIRFGVWLDREVIFPAESAARQHRSNAAASPIDAGSSG